MSENALQNKFFYGVEEDVDVTTYWFGRVIGSPAPGWFLLQGMDIETGSDFNHCTLRSVEDMQNWQFFCRYDDVRKHVETYGPKKVRLPS
jgi:hypothetical protein